MQNARPLTPLSSDPNILTALTPGHFFIEEPLTSSADPHAKDAKYNLSNRWKIISQLKLEFWNIGTSEYLHTLQHRYKWKKEIHDIQSNTMVLIKEDNLPALKWSPGRIQNVIRGEDGLIRVAAVKTANRLIRRPIAKLAPLPLEVTQPEEPSRSDNDNSSGASSAKRARIAPTLLSTVLLAILILPLCLASNIEGQPFQRNPGIYFEHIGNAHIIKSEWDIISYVDLTSYWKWSKQIKQYPENQQKICKTPLRHNCDTMISLITQAVNEINSNNELLYDNQQKRVKRGAINIVGNIAISLFGVLDESYATDMA